MRLFIAFDLPAPVAQEYAGIIKKTSESVPRGIKFVKPENLHITLAFLGEINPEDVSKINRELNIICSETEEFTVYAPKLEVFPARNPCIFWVNLSSEDDFVYKIPGKIRRKIKQLGYDADNKKLKLHVTLGRIKSAINPEKMKSLLYFDFNMKKYKITKVSLYKSILRPQGSVYEKLSSCNLRRKKHD
ncbi:MAG: RNA 2',3'-cyclic phosphodiesterase [Candidatus Cloacimonadota bacterium]|nr:MAG: RNA 2',3'-cyclic phosphodiesterase [Candidatus Cloacimonadota bacterium]